MVAMLVLQLGKQTALKYFVVYSQKVAEPNKSPFAPVGLNNLAAWLAFVSSAILAEIVD